MALQKVRNNVEVLHNAIVDGINRYVRDVLIAKGLVDQSKLQRWTEGDLDELKHAVAGCVAAAWETCEIDEHG
jgi:hypothetical protein